MELFENAAGAIIDMLIELVALTLLAAAIVPVLHGTVGSEMSWLALLVGIALVALEVSRIFRNDYVFGAGPLAREVWVDTTSVPYLVADALVLTLGAAWLVRLFVAAPGLASRTDLGFDLGVPAIILTVGSGLLGARIWARGESAPGDEPAEDLAGAVLDFFIQGSGLLLVAGGGVDLSHGWSRDRLHGGLPAFTAGAALLVLLVSRIIRGGYVLNKDALPITVSTVSMPYYVSDALLLGFGTAWLYHSLTESHGPGFVDGTLGTSAAVVFVAVTSVLLVVRVSSRLRVRHP
jgi:hypothetical protein